MQRISRVAQAYQHEPEERSLDIDKQIKQMQKSGNVSVNLNTIVSS